MTKDNSKACQPGLPFRLAVEPLGFITGAFNDDAISRLCGWLDRFSAGDHGIAAMAVTGSDGAGKSRLLHHLAERFGGTVIQPDEGGELRTAVTTGLLALDDSHRAEAFGLFAAFNQAIGGGRPLIITGRGRPEEWGTEGGVVAPLPDLASRLGALAIAEIDGPDTEILSRALQTLLTNAGVLVSSAEIDHFVRQRLRRRFGAVIDIAQAAIGHAFEDRMSGKDLLARAMNDNPQHSL